MRQRGLPWRQGEAMDKGDAIQRILESSNFSRCAHDVLNCRWQPCSLKY